MKLRPVASLISLVGLIGLASACSGPQPAPSDARTVVVSLQKIDCVECGNQLVADLRERPGVYGASFDKQKAELSVVSSPAFDVFTTVRQLSAQQGYQAILGEGQGRYQEEPAYPAGADVQTIVKGGVDVPSLDVALVKGKVTIVDFSAPWCRPCHKVDEHMARVLVGRGDLAYRRLDIGDWDTPLAQRYLKSVPQLPYLIIYDAAGVKVKDLFGLDLPALDAAIAQAAARK